MFRAVPSVQEILAKNHKNDFFPESALFKSTAYEEIDCFFSMAKKWYGFKTDQNSILKIYELISGGDSWLTYQNIKESLAFFDRLGSKMLKDRPVDLNDYMHHLIQNPEECFEKSRALFNEVHSDKKPVAESLLKEFFDKFETELNNQDSVSPGHEDKVSFLMEAGHKAGFEYDNSLITEFCSKLAELVKRNDCEKVSDLVDEFTNKLLLGEFVRKLNTLTQPQKINLTCRTKTGETCSDPYLGVARKKGVRKKGVKDMIDASN